MHTRRLTLAGYAMTTDDQQQFVLKWHYHETTLIQNLPYLLENDVLSDVTISVGGAQHVKAHKIILAMCSVYFLQLFQEMKNTQHPVVVLHNASIDDVRAMLAFMYRGQCVVSKDQLPNLLSVARLLKIQGLCDMKVPENKTTKDEDDVASIPAIDKNKISAESYKDLPLMPLTRQQDSTQTRNEEDDDEDDERCISEITYGASSSSPSANKSSLRRHSTSGDCGYVSTTAINLSIDNKRVRLSTWEKPSTNNLPSFDNSPKDDAIPIPSYYASSPSSSSTMPRTKQQHQASPNKEYSETCKCFLCGKYLSNQYNLRVHMETHEEAYHACQSCPHVSRSRDALRKHVSYRHPEEYLTRKRKRPDSS